PEGLERAPGDVVEVPLGPRHIVGVVWESERLAAKDVPDAKLRAVAAKLPVWPLTPAMRRLVEWVADYYVAPVAGVLRMTLSVSSALGGGRTMVEYRPSGVAPARITPQRAAALERIAGRQGAVRDLARWGAVSDAVIRGLAACGA